MARHMTPDKPRGPFFTEYAEAFRKHYPAARPAGLVKELLARAPKAFKAEKKRFHRPTQRRGVGGKAFLRSSERTDLTLRWAYKGLITVTVPYDVMLFSNLIWELQPKTILELGAMHGGTSLWYADQLDIHCGGGTVHAWDYYEKAVSPRAKHPRLHFHGGDLAAPQKLDQKLLAGLPHPWIVVHDVPVSSTKMLDGLNKFVKSGDYWVVKGQFGFGPMESVLKSLAAFEAKGYLVDSRYTDAFGYNVTGAPNGWFRKK
jgi:cephalosporin hydroxylase